VGFTHIVTAWRQNTQLPALGVEPNGALAWSEDEQNYFERDSLAALSTVLTHLPSPTTLDDAIADLRRQHPYPQRIITVPNTLDETLNHLRTALSTWDMNTTHDAVTLFDGGPHGQITVRASGTEPGTRLYTEIEAVPDRLPTGHSAVLLTGSLRQATAFATGGALRMVTGIDIAVNQRGQLWSSSEPYDAPLAPGVTEHSVGRGDELAVALAVATDPTEDVLEFVCKRELPIERLLVLHPPAGTKDNAVPDAAAAVALAVGVRDTVRQACRNNPRVHLFLAGPMGLALLLGHRWNRVRPTVVYEDVQDELVYELAFTLDA
jgi:hypothetical protein